MKIPALLLLLSLSLAADELPSVPAMRSAADAFLASLDEARRAKAAFPFSDEGRENFRFTPQKRGGLPLKEMSAPQKEAAMKLLESALSEKGRLKVTDIMVLEGVLAEIERRPDYRDAGAYFVSVFGKPAEGSAWGWKFEGHHVSINYTLDGSGKIAVTPSFLGANPAEVREGTHKGLRVLKAEDELAHKLVLSLLDSGRKDVVFTKKAPAETITAENRKVTALEPVGVPLGEMTPDQRKDLLVLISEYTGRNRKDIAEADMKKIAAAGIDKIRFGWAGGTAPGEAWYYRIQGPTFLMEAANTQNNANHIHATWRDFDGDFGRDILAEHYRQHDQQD